MFIDNNQKQYYSHQRENLKKKHRHYMIVCSIDMYR